MNTLTNKLRNSALIATSVIAAAFMGLFSLMMIGSILFLGLILLPLGALTAFLLPKATKETHSDAEPQTV